MDRFRANSLNRVDRADSESTLDSQSSLDRLDRLDRLDQGVGNEYWWVNSSRPLIPFSIKKPMNQRLLSAIFGWAKKTIARQGRDISRHINGGTPYPLPLVMQELVVENIDYRQASGTESQSQAFQAFDRRPQETLDNFEASSPPVYFTDFCCSQEHPKTKVCIAKEDRELSSMEDGEGRITLKQLFDNGALALLSCMVGNNVWISLETLDNGASNPLCNGQRVVDGAKNFDLNKRLEVIYRRKNARLILRVFQEGLPIFYKGERCEALEKLGIH